MSLPPHVSVCTTRVWVPMEARTESDPLRLELQAVVSQQRWVQGLNAAPLEGQQVLVIAELPLQPSEAILKEASKGFIEIIEAKWGKR